MKRDELLKLYKTLTDAKMDFLVSYLEDKITYYEYLDYSYPIDELLKKLESNLKTLS